MTNKTITITIDGKEIPATLGQTIIQAADAAGIYIPRLCYHKDMLPGGHCRMCTIRANGRPASACTYPVSPDLVVENDTEEINQQRRNILEMLFVEGNHVCPSCEAGGRCELQALAYRLGMVVPEMPYLNQERDIDASHPDVYLDRSRCILCGRCVRASRQVDGKSVFAFEGRGIEKRITVNSDQNLADTDMDMADKSARICPTGCLVVKREGYATPVGQRLYDKAPIGSDIEEETAEA